MVYVGADHGGYALKEVIRRHLLNEGLAVVDLGPRRLRRGDDFPEIAERIARAVAAGPDRLGILVCRSGIGMSMVANKVLGIRAVQADDAVFAVRARREENANVLAMGADRVTSVAALRIVDSFLATSPASTPRYRRRRRQLQRIDARHRRSLR